MPTLQRDRFDDVPDLARVGSHRAPNPRGRGWVVFAWAALATGVLVGAGYLGLTAIEARVAGDTAASSATAPSVAATVDPKLDVVVLNATTTTGLAATAEKRAQKAGWTVQSVANASSTDVKTSTVYYTLAGESGAAAGLAETLGITRTTLSKQYAAGGNHRLTVVLGKDWAARNG